jgi:hypothetical protein
VHPCSFPGSIRNLAQEQVRSRWKAGQLFPRVDHRYVIVGAGAIGGTVGGVLARAGVPTVLIARGRHAEVLATEATSWSSRPRPNNSMRPCRNGWTNPSMARMVSSGLRASTCRR